MLVFADCHCHRHVEDVFYAVLFFGTTLHIHGAHLLGDDTALVWRYRGETLGFEKLDAVSLATEVGFKAEEQDGGKGAEVKDLGVPLDDVSRGR